MTSENWSVMQDLEDAFSKISTVDFLLEQLQEAADAEDNLAVVDISTALNAYLSVFTRHYDDKFKTAWNHTVGMSKELPGSILFKQD